MQPHEFNLYSTFFKVLRFINGKPTSYYRIRDWDTCKLIRHVLISVFVIGVIRLSICLAVMSFFLAILTCVGLDPMAFIVGVDVDELSNWHMVGACLLGTVIVFSIIMSGCCLMLAGMALSNWWDGVTFFKATKHIDSEPVTPAKTLYRSWKDKACSKVTFKDY